MKKIIIKGIIFIIIGFILGEIIFSNRIETLQKFNNKEKYYFLQEGVYKDKNTLNNNLSKVSNKVIDYQDNKYYVYVGITKDIKIANRLKDIYEKDGINVYMKEKHLSSEEFSTNVEQFDLLIRETKDIDQVLTIEEVILANYEEIIKKK